MDENGHVFTLRVEVVLTDSRKLDPQEHEMKFNSIYIT